MKTKRLIEILKIMPDDTEVYIQTVPEDFAQPLEMKNISVWGATADKINDNYIGINREKLVITSYFPEKNNDHR